MALGKFTAYTVIAVAIWCTALVSLGYSLGGSYKHVLKAFSYAGYVAAVLAVIAVVVVFLHRWRAYRTERDRLRAESAQPGRP
jgi:membrane protein DedA with SNARE-associated domain